MNIKKIKGLMAENEETQKELAALLNLTVRSISNKMTGKTRFNVNEIKKIADHYKVDVAILIC